MDLKKVFALLVTWKPENEINNRNIIKLAEIFMTKCI